MLSVKKNFCAILAIFQFFHNGTFEPKIWKAKLGASVFLPSKNLYRKCVPVVSPGNTSQHLKVANALIAHHKGAFI